MSGLNLLPIFLIGLLGSVHCVGMCGGIVGAISAVRTSTRRFPLTIVTAAAKPVAGLDIVGRVLLYNVGRLSSYALIGAIFGGVAGGARTLTGLSSLQMGGYWLANLMLVALGLYLMGAWKGLVYLELAGYSIWKRIQSLTKKLLPLDSPLKMLAIGSLWGWLPCGMVYSMLFTAMLSGSAISGAIVMLVFGLGTLPMLLAMGLLGAKWKTWMQQPKVRLLGGLIVLCFGLLGLNRAAHGMPMTWLDALCVTPSIAEGASWIR
jgi:sulfite exporter TauE/SafE